MVKWTFCVRGIRTTRDREAEVLFTIAAIEDDNCQMEGLDDGDVRKDAVGSDCEGGYTDGLP